MFSSHLGDHTLASKVDGASPKFFYSITGSSAKKKLFLKLVNGSSDPQQVHLELPDAKLAPTAQVETLRGMDTQATNTIDHPEQIVPVKSELHVGGNSLQHTLPPYTIQVIEFDEQ
jgi:alpha-N-arabinofuranosidase